MSLADWMSLADVETERISRRNFFLVIGVAYTEHIA